MTERLSSLDLLVVADFVPSETARMADVVLPVTQWAEEEGTLTNLEGRVLRRRALLSPPAGVRTDLEILQDLVFAAVTDALAQSKQLAADKMAAVTGGMGLPGMGGLPGLR